MVNSLKVVIDIETNSLDNPTQVWVIVSKNLETGELDVFRNCTTDPSEAARFAEYFRSVELAVGHNWLEFDYPWLYRLLGVAMDDVYSQSIDTLVLSRLLDYSDPHDVAKGKHAENVELVRVAGRHSIESYGLEFGYEKLKFNDFSKFSEEMVQYCIRDVEVCEKIYRKYAKYINDPAWRKSIELEHRFQEVINSLQKNGFAFNKGKAEKILDKVTKELGELDEKIAKAFPPKLVLLREVVPRYTQHGTLNRNDFRWYKSLDLSIFNGGPFSLLQEWRFNPASHKQIIDVLHTANWSPIDKTQGHLEADRHPNEVTTERQEHLKKYGWKINENNLSTLPSSAPGPAKLLAKRILLESRRRTLTEWLSLVNADERIHGKFYGIGAWTGRMAHQKPNTANIPNEFDINGRKKLLGKELRSLWHAPKNRLLVGVDAEGIQLRIFAHYINDPEFTDALVRGKKDDKTDPHSLNQRILGSVCPSRAAAKRFIYALLLGGGIWKLSQILECSETECRQALDRLLRRYQGWAVLKEQDIPRDGKRGWFVGLDGRKVRIPGATQSERRHLAMSGYLQNGEAVCMKLATTLFFSRLKEYDAKLVNFVHDEWQTEVPNNVTKALEVASLQALALKEAGTRLNLRCPLAGSYWNDDLKDWTVGTNWSVTH